MVGMSAFKEGDLVRLVGMPRDLHEETQAVFEQCKGQVFRVDGFNEIGWARICVESVTGSCGETIWAEPQYLEAAG
jgi:hypothetical protein